MAAAQLARLGIVTEPETLPRKALPDTTTVQATPEAEQRVAVQKPAPEVTRLLDRVLLPDLRGLTVNQVRTVTAAAELVVQISGKGLAVAQDPPPGTVVKNPAVVSVRFEPRADSI